MRIIKTSLIIFLLLSLIACLPEESEAGLTDSEIAFLLWTSLPDYHLETGCPGPDLAFLDNGQTYSHTFDGTSDEYWFTFNGSTREKRHTIKYSEAAGQDIQVFRVACGTGRRFESDDDSGAVGSNEEIEFGGITPPSQFPRILVLFIWNSGSKSFSFTTE